jgi:hypothetical protein
MANPLKVHNGIAWVEPQSIKRYDGSSWQDVKVSVYDGTKWFTSYEATAGVFGGIFIDDFHTTGGSDPMDARITYATTGLQDGESFPTDGDSNVVTTRPVWTYNNGDAGTSHVDNDKIRFAYAGTHPQYRTTNVPEHSNFSGTLNFEFSFYQTSSSNKDLMFAIDCISQADYWSSANLDEGYFFQFDDSSSRWIRARRRNTSSATTLGTSSNSAFTQDAWNTAKITWNQSTGAITVSIGGVLKLSVNDTSYDDFGVSGAGIRFMHARFMSPASAYSEIDWIKIWKS